MARPRKNSNTPETREQILRAARIEFAAQGMAAPLDAIAARCGIRRPSLLHHFKNKDVLIAAVIEDILEKARSRLLAAIADGNNDYSSTMKAVLAVLRDLEAEEQGVTGMMAQSLLMEQQAGPVTLRVAEFIEVIHAAAMMVGASRDHSSADIRAAIAHLVVGEVVRAALGERAEQIWGQADGANLLFEAYFLRENRTDA